MKNTIIGLLVSMGIMMSTAAFADDLKNNSNEMKKPENLSTQVIDNGKDADGKKIVNALPSSKEESEPKRPFHFVGHSE